jgi:hypothetical protein
LTTNIVTGDFHLYLRDLQAGTTTLLDADTERRRFPQGFPESRPPDAGRTLCGL